MLEATTGSAGRSDDVDDDADNDQRDAETRTYFAAAATFGVSANIRSGLPSLVIVDSSTTTRARFDSEGRSYMTSSRTCSRIDRSPRAPVLRASALRAIA